MMEVTKTLADKQYQVLRGGETIKVQIVPQLLSSLRLDLKFWQKYPGLSCASSLVRHKYIKEDINIFKKTTKPLHCT